MKDTTQREDRIVGYWRCPVCGHMNRPENTTCVFKCAINEETIVRPEQLNG